MAYNLDTTITGAPSFGLTSPTYTIKPDLSPDNRSRQAYVNTLGGTQDGVHAHTAGTPATLTVRRPGFWKTIRDAVYNGALGRYTRVPFNEHLVLVRWSAEIADGQHVPNEFRFTQKVAAGSELFDSENIRAPLSFLIGFLWSQSGNVGDASTNGQI